ncbi:hypothetical protein Tco_0512570 [Tanacetum coccineum]
MQSVSLKQRLVRKRSLKKQWVHKESVSKQGRKFAKGEPSIHRDPLFDDIPKIHLIIWKLRMLKLWGDKDIVGKLKAPMSKLKVLMSKEKRMHIIAKDLLILESSNAVSREKGERSPPKIDPKDKGKKKIEEEDESESESDGIPEAEKKFKQLASDEEMARKYKKSGKARIEADILLAEKLQEEEREQFTIEERSKFLHDTIAAQRKFLAQQRSEAIRNRPPTKNQLRN